MSPAAAACGARWAAAGQCDHAIASSTAAAAGSVHFFIVISSGLCPLNIEQNMIKFASYISRSLLERHRLPLDEEPLFLQPVIEMGHKLAVVVPFEGWHALVGAEHPFRRLAPAR